MATGNVQEELQVLKNDLNKLRGDVTDLVGVLKALGLEKIDETRGSVEEELEAQRERLRVLLAQAKERGRGAADEIEQHVNEHPIGSLLTAFGIGYILAKLSGGKS